MSFVIQRIKSRTILVLQDAKLIRFYSTVKVKMWLISNLYMETAPDQETWQSFPKSYTEDTSHISDQ